MTSHRLSEDAAGIYIISVTPFTEQGEIDFAAADKLVEYYIEAGVSGITILGMMGEAPKLAPDESTAFLDHMLERVAERVPVVVGVSNPGLANLARLSSRAMDRGAAGVMIAPTPGLGSEDKIIAYYDQVMAALGPEVPVVYQDYPQATGVYISVETFNRLVARHDQLVMLKHEDCPGLGKLSRVRQTALDQGLRRVSVLVGNGGLYLPQEMARGADGGMTGFAVPEMLVNVVRLCRAGDWDAAEDLFDAYLPLVRYEQQPGFGLAVRKEILRRRGVLTSAATRAPGPTLSAVDQAELTRLMERVAGNVDSLELEGFAA